jgi:hypothetical protein
VYFFFRLIAQGNEGAIKRLIRRNLGVLQPRSVYVTIEVILRTNGLILGGGIDAIFSGHISILDG